MNCDQVRNLMPEVLDEGVLETERVHVQAHLSSCQKCSDEWTVLNKTWNTSDKFPVPAVDPMFTASVMQRVESIDFDSCSPDAENSFIAALYRYRLACCAAVAAFAVVVLSLLLLFVDFKPDKASIDERVVRDLEVFENLELLQNLELLTDLEIILYLQRDAGGEGS